MICNCCKRPITARNIAPDHVYRVGVYAEITPRTVQRYSWQYRAVCAGCVRRIERAHERRRAARTRLIARPFAVAATV